MGIGLTIIQSYPVPKTLTVPVIILLLMYSLGFMPWHSYNEYVSEFAQVHLMSLILMISKRSKLLTTSQRHFRCLRALREHGHLLMTMGTSARVLLMRGNADWAGESMIHASRRCP